MGHTKDTPPVMNAPDLRRHPPPLCNRLEDLTSVAEFQAVFRNIFQEHWAYVSNGGKFTCPTFSPEQIVSGRANGKVRGCIIDLDLPSAGEALKATGNVCRLAWSRPFGCVAYPGCSSFHPMEKPQSSTEGQEACLYRCEAESLVYVLDWFLTHLNRTLGETQDVHFMNLDPKHKSSQKRSQEILSSTNHMSRRKYPRLAAPMVDGWLIPFWRLIHEGYFLMQKYPAESLEYQTLCGCLTPARIKDVLADKEERVLKAALALPLPPDDGDDFPENRRPVVQRLSYTRSLDEFKEAFVGIVEAHHEFCARFCICFGPFTPNRLAFRESQSFPGGSEGVFIDLDEMRPPTPSQFVTRRTDPLVFPFAALEIIRLPLDCGNPYYYRHDLESFMYTLYWYAVRGRFSQKKNRMILQPITYPNWSSSAWNFTDKDYTHSRFRTLIGDRLEFLLSLGSHHFDVTPDFEGLAWLISLWRLVRSAHLLSSIAPGNAEPRTLKGRLTYELFISALRPAESAPAN